MEEGLPTEVDAHVFVLNLRCIECNERWDDPTDRWRIYFTGEESPTPVTYCPACAAKEFSD